MRNRKWIVPQRGREQEKEGGMETGREGEIQEVTPTLSPYLLLPDPVFPKLSRPLNLILFKL